MNVSPSTSNFDYYDIYHNNPFAITNNFSPLSYHHIISGEGISSTSTTTTTTTFAFSSMLKINRNSLLNNNIKYQSIIATTTLTTSSHQSEDLHGIDIDINDSSDSVDGASTNGKLRNGAANVDPNLAFWAVIDGVLLVFILGGNFLTIIAVRFSRRLRSITSNLFILSLAISDIVVGFTLPYHLAFYMGSGLDKTKELCLLRFFLIILACCNSIWNLIAIAVDRYIAIFFPLHYSRYMTKKVAIVLLGFGWVVGITFATIPLIWNNWDTATQCEFDEIFKPWYMAGVITPGFSMVWLCMLIVYLRIWREATKHAKQLRSSFTGLHETPSDSKSVQVVLFILGCFSFCWLPYFIIACVQIFKYVDKSTPMLYKAAFSLAMANSGVNPIIYAWKNTGFRRAFARLLRCQSPDYNDASQHSIRSLNKRRKSSVSQHQQQSNQQKFDNIISTSDSSLKIRINEAATTLTTSSLHNQNPPLSSIASSTIAGNGINLHKNTPPKNFFSLKSSSNTPKVNAKSSSGSVIISINKSIGSTRKDKSYNQNMMRTSTINSNNNKVTKLSLKRKESSDNDKISTPHGIFQRKTSFGTVTTTIINTSTDDDDGDYDCSNNQIGHNVRDISSNIDGSNNSISGLGHDNVLMSTIVSLDAEKTSTYTVDIADNDDFKGDSYNIKKEYLDNKIQNQNEQIQSYQKKPKIQQNKKKTKCIASISVGDINKISTTIENNIENGCNSSVGSYREGFIVQKIQCDGNGNNKTKCVCELDPKELKRKLYKLHEWSSNSSITSSNSRGSITSNFHNNCHNKWCRCCRSIQVQI